jgi:hypothetical protein
MSEVAEATETTETSAADEAVVASTETTTETPASEESKTTTLLKTEETTATEEKPASVVPEKYELKLPENSVLDETAIERTTAIARELGLSNEAAQKSLEFLNTETASAQEALLMSLRPGGALWTAEVNDWEAKALNDPVIGGTPEKLKASVELAKGVVRTYGDESLVEFLEKSGFGSNPTVIRMLSKIGKATAEKAPLPTGGTQVTKDDPLRKKYPHPDNWKEPTS